ncbi:hypothetical protein QYF61_019172 [Mycteria americana]|uniref:Secreted protein n=1 Tax=Mycteria americana TaxID=33587 RepID=A0AAN7NH34_MYCAM|nr:hypothetical protein QYF61_019172 [Mycteria americana]
MLLAFLATWAHCHLMFSRHVQVHPCQGDVLEHSRGQVGTGDRWHLASHREQLWGEMLRSIRFFQGMQTRAVPRVVPTKPLSCR